MELVGPVSQIPDVIADNIVPVLREALSNIARHAAADAGGIELRVTDDEVRLTVEDDGVGLSTRTSENGLRHARRRAETLGGSLDVHQRHPRGYERSSGASRSAEPARPPGRPGPGRRWRG